MSEKFIPRDYQKIAIKWLKSHARCAIFLQPGLGKTSSTLQALVEFNEWPVLVVAPLRVAQTAWPDEVGKWDEFKHLKVSVLTGSKVNRLKALETPADIYTINYENLPWLITQLGSKWKFKTVVADEITKLKSFRLRQGGKQAQALGRVAFTGVKRFIGLTGTPMPRHLSDLWGQIWFIDKGERLEKTFSKFTEKYFTVGYDGFSLNEKPGAKEQVLSAINDVCLSIDASEYFPTEKPIHVEINIDLPEKVKKVYREMEKEMFIDIGENGIEAFSAAAKINKCLQISAGGIYKEDKTYEVLHEERLRVLEDISEEMQTPVLVSYQYKFELDMILKRFPKARHLDKNPQTIEDWNNGKIEMLVAHPASAGHGLSLQYGGNVLVYYSHGWNLEHHQQIVERIGPARQKQAGLDRPVYVYSILGKDTVEMDVYERLLGKATEQDILLRFLNRSKKYLDEVT